MHAELPVADLTPTGADGAPMQAAPASTAREIGWLPVALGVFGLAAAAALIATVMLWQRVSGMQEQLARQSADTAIQAVEARTVAREAQATAQKAAARIGVTEARVAEVALQRTQLEELMQSLSRSRDENLVVDIESAVRLAQQQAELTGSLEPILGTLRTADQRIARAAQPRLAPVQRAVARDMERIRSAATADIPGLLSRLDDMVRLIDDLPLQNAVAQVLSSRSVMPARVGVTAVDDPEPLPDAALPWWRRQLLRAWNAVRAEARGLVRVSQIDRPEAVLLAPEQTFFLRENLKLKLVNARLGVLARQNDSARADLAGAAMALNKYFDPASRRVQNMAGLLQQAQAQMKNVELPRPDDTLAALATAAAGR